MQDHHECCMSLLWRRMEVGERKRRVAITGQYLESYVPGLILVHLLDVRSLLLSSSLNFKLTPATSERWHDFYVLATLYLWRWPFYRIGKTDQFSHDIMTKLVLWVTIRLVYRSSMAMAQQSSSLIKHPKGIVILMGYRNLNDILINVSLIL